MSTLAITAGDHSAAAPRIGVSIFRRLIDGFLKASHTESG